MAKGSRLAQRITRTRGDLRAGREAGVRTLASGALSVVPCVRGLQAGGPAAEDAAPATEAR